MFSTFTIKVITIAIILMVIRQVRGYLLSVVRREKKASLDQFKAYCKKRKRAGL